jgi:hypothetical protein
MIPRACHRTTLALLSKRKCSVPRLSDAHERLQPLRNAVVGEGLGTAAVKPLWVMV